MRRVLILVMCACGGTSETQRNEPLRAHETQGAEPSTEAESSTETELPSPDTPTRQTEAVMEVRAEPALVPQRGHRSFIRVMHIVRDRPVVLTGTMSGGVVSVIDVPTGHVRAARRLFRGSILELNASADGTRVLARGTEYYSPDGGTYALWDLRNDRAVSIDLEGVGTAAIAPNGERMAFVQLIGERVVLHIRSTEGDARMSRDLPEGGTLQFTSDGSALLLSGDDEVVILDPTSGETRATVPVPGLHGIDVASSVARIAAVGRESVVVFDAQGELNARLALTATQVRFTPRANALVACVNGTLVVQSGRRFASARETTVPCAGHSVIDARFDPATIANSSLRREGVEPKALGFQTFAIAVPRSVRRRWFLAASEHEIFIYNLRRDRVRRMVEEGWTESSVWSVERNDSTLSLRGRGWVRDFPRTVRRLRPLPEGSELVGTSPDGSVRTFTSDPYHDHPPTLMREGSAPRVLSLPANARYFCDDLEVGPGCPTSVWGPGNRFLLSMHPGVASYAADGRLLGHSPTATQASYANDSTLIVQHDNGALTLTNLDFRRRAGVFNPRRGGTTRYASDGSARVAATRGRVLQIVDIASGEQRLNITLSENAIADPVLHDEYVQLQTDLGFVRWSIADGSEIMRVALNDVRALSTNQTEALHCDNGRLLWRRLDEDRSVGLMPCPRPGWISFDSDFVYWVDGNLAHVLRRSDRQRLTLRALGTHGLATTPQGHAFVTSNRVLPQVRLRGAGPILDASLEVVSETQLKPGLIDDFLAGRTLE